MHGIGQGNGAGPAIWAVVSTPLLNLLRSKGFGFNYTSPISTTKISFVGYTFVDDTDLLQVLSTQHTSEEVVHMLQQSVDTWEGGLRATCGALIPEKTFWSLVDFAWEAGEWRYKHLAECPGAIFANDIHGNRKELQRVEVNDAQATLGVALAPSGDTSKQAENMVNSAIQWADAMRSGRISKSEVWLAITSTIWRTLTYPLPAINLTREQCEKIMAPILQYGLPNMGVCRNFPRDMVFAPQQYFSLGLQHLYTSQEIYRLKDMIQHTFRTTCTGQLYRSSLELLYVELGVSMDLHEISYQHMSALATNSLVKSSWYFLSTYDIKLAHDIKIEGQRKGDKPIMEIFLYHNIHTSELRSINKCRLFLQAFFLSDIADGSGMYVTDDSWQGMCQGTVFKTESWPQQGNPTRADWDIWRKNIRKYILGRGMRLQQRLGSWNRFNNKWPWYYSTKDGALYHLSEQGWQYFHPINDRKVRPVFSRTGKSVTQVPHLN
jgi:hypothetical protein